MTISIHAPRVGCDNIFALLAVVGRISIHAPRVGRDSARPCRLTAVVYFNPRAPCGARRCCDVTPATRDCISIHAPRVGRDHRNWYYISYNYNFNPRAPCGARPFFGQEMTASFLFQSTRPVWGATLSVQGLGLFRCISIHAPRVGRDNHGVPFVSKQVSISIHAPRVGRDRKFDDFTPSNLHKRYKRVLARPKNTRKKGKIKQNLAYIHAFSAFLGCEGSGTFCALVLRTQYR